MGLVYIELVHSYDWVVTGEVYDINQLLGQTNINMIRYRASVIQ